MKNTAAAFLCIAAISSNFASAEPICAIEENSTAEEVNYVKSYSIVQRLNTQVRDDRINCSGLGDVKRFIAPTEDEIKSGQIATTCVLDAPNQNYLDGGTTKITEHAIGKDLHLYNLVDNTKFGGKKCWVQVTFSNEAHNILGMPGEAK